VPCFNTDILALIEWFVAALLAFFGWLLVSLQSYWLQLADSWLLCGDTGS
jgi:hypothetical protein